MLGVSALLVEKYYIGRLAIAGNAFFLYELFYPKWNTLPESLQFYLNLVLVIGAIALVSYIFKKSLTKEFYKLAKYLVGSQTIILILLFFYL